MFIISSFLVYVFCLIHCSRLHLYTFGHVLSSVQEAKYLGITLTDELSWSSRFTTAQTQPLAF